MSAPNDPTSSSSKVWIIAIVLVVLAGVGAVVLARGGDDEVEGQTGSVQVGDDSSTTAGEGATTEDEAPAALPQYDATVEPDPAVGMQIPTVTGTTFDGEELTISPDDGKAKIILFVAHWCPHCQREIPRLAEHLAENPLPDDVELITVSTSVEPSGDNYPPQEWLEREGWDAPTIADDEDSTIAATYGLSAFPYFVAVDAQGEVVSRATGELTTEQFDQVVAEAQGS